MSFSWHPALNACLNAASGICLVVGRVLIARKDVEGHRRAMTAACACSATFLVSYVVYHAYHGSQSYPGTGALRTVYLSILASHTLLAMSLVWFVPRTYWLGVKRRDAQHRRLARWTFPIWLYVSVTGIVVYLMLYVFPPDPPPG